MLSELLNYSKLMSTAIHRLEEKVDSLQSKVYNLQRVTESKEKSPSSLTVVPPSTSSRSGLSHPDLELKRRPPIRSPFEAHRLSPLPASLPTRGRPRIPQLRYKIHGLPQPAFPTNFQFNQQASGSGGSSDVWGRGGIRTREKRSRGGTSDTDQPSMPPAKNPQAEMLLLAQNTMAAERDDQLVLIGRPVRNVQILASEYLKAFKEKDPQSAVVVVLRAVFPISVLSQSGITGNPDIGIQQLDPNKIEAIREWLVEMFPLYNLSVRGRDWATCLGAIRCVTIQLRSAEGPGILRLAHELGYSDDASWGAL
ncbi:hypothetical protein AAFF_G00236940 [Aldrovandia affinis]|uniref:BEN domain-containing protein n=1 Tax=Aldrovandia affinis TaxID=143900 RepID=A0AAD7REQ7_9TELE|nr:hypothetical protein AAFF_G00236940 [Aldrovandia affinis]